jgi:hypothetical protein
MEFAGGQAEVFTDSRGRDAFDDDEVFTFDSDLKGES